MCIGMFFRDICVGSALRLFGPNADYYVCFGLSGCGMCHFDFGSHECFPHYDARFHFIATYLCGICLSIC